METQNVQIPENPPIVIEQSFNVSVERVWHALTKSDEMKQWFFEQIHTFIPEIGFQTEFNVSPGNGKNYSHLWQITKLVPQQKMELSWKYGGYAGDSHVEFDLTAVGRSTNLKLTHTGHETFPMENPTDEVFSTENCVAGWNYFICERLKSFLEK